MEQSEDTDAVIGDALVQPGADGQAYVTVSNPCGVSLEVTSGSCVGTASSVTVVEAAAESRVAGCLVRTVQSNDDTGSSDEWCRQKLLEVVGKPELLDGYQLSEFEAFLVEYHSAFSLEDGEREETSLTEMDIDTGDATPKKLPARRMPLAVRREVSRQLQAMQAAGVIQPSNSPWSSAVVLVRKKDGSQRFCVDYRALNSVTKTDTYPLPRIDDLLDQLGNSRFFSTLD